jgi:hypothetical protein
MWKHEALLGVTAAAIGGTAMIILASDAEAQVPRLKCVPSTSSEDACKFITVKQGTLLVNDTTRIIFIKGTIEILRRENGKDVRTKKPMDFKIAPHDARAPPEDSIDSGTFTAKFVP